MITRVASNYMEVSQATPPDALIAGIAEHGSMEAYIADCIQNERLRLGALYPDNAHEVIESAVTTIGRSRLNIISDIINAGFVTNLPDWWAIPSLRRGRTGQGANAHRSMVPDSRGERFVLSRDGVSWPIYCTWSNFSFNARELAIAQRMGTPLDVSHAEDATFAVNELAEDQSIHGLTDDQGSPMTIDGLSAPGLLDADSTLFDYATWTGLTGSQIVDIVKAAIEELRLKKFYGPFTMWVPGNFTDVLTKDYTTNYPKTVIARLLELGPYGGRNLEIKFADLLPDNRVVIAQMTKNNLDVILGQTPLPVSWQDGPKWNTFWVILACVIFRMFANKNGDYGIAVGDLT